MEYTVSLTLSLFLIYLNLFPTKQSAYPKNGRIILNSNTERLVLRVLHLMIYLVFIQFEYDPYCVIEEWKSCNKP